MFLIRIIWHQRQIEDSNYCSSYNLSQINHNLLLTSPCCVYILLYSVVFYEKVQYLLDIVEKCCLVFAQNAELKNGIFSRTWVLHTFRVSIMPQAWGNCQMFCLIFPCFAIIFRGNYLRQLPGFVASVTKEYTPLQKVSKRLGGPASGANVNKRVCQKYNNEFLRTPWRTVLSNCGEISHKYRKVFIVPKKNLTMS